MIRGSRLLCFAIAIGLTCWGGWLFVASSTEPPVRFVMENPVADLGERRPGFSEVVLSFRNDSDQPHEVISVVEGCGPGCCIRLKDSVPVIVPPGDTRKIRCLLDIRQPGPFEITSEAFLSENGLRPVKFVLRGVAVAPKAAPRGGTTHVGKTP